MRFTSPFQWKPGESWLPTISIVLIVLLGLVLTVLASHPLHRLPVVTPVAQHPSPRAPATPTRRLSSPCAADPAHLPPARGSGSLPLDYWHTCGSQIVDRNGQPILIRGVAWSGMELPGGAPQGLDRRNYAAVLLDVKALGYNVVRIPFDSVSIQPGYVPSGISFQANPELRGLSALEILDRIIAECHAIGLKVILDHHRISPWSAPPLWFDGSYSEDQWVADWQRLARRYAGNDTVIGFDLQNEPYGATWGNGDPKTDWRRAAARAGNAILAVNPYTLIFVEGIGKRQGVYYWYGGELQDVATAPLQLSVPGRLVYSPHEYGPSVYPQPWFSAPDFPSNLPSIWEQHWAFIAERRIAPVVIGEMGAPETGYDAGGVWQRTLLSYLDEHHLGFITWALNPTSTDTGGVLEADWTSLNAARQALYAPYLKQPG